MLALQVAVAPSAAATRDSPPPRANAVHPRRPDVQRRDATIAGSVHPTGDVIRIVACAAARGRSGGAGGLAPLALHTARVFLVALGLCRRGSASQHGLPVQIHCKVNAVAMVGCRV